MRVLKGRLIMQPSRMGIAIDHQVAWERMRRGILNSNHVVARVSQLTQILSSLVIGINNDRAAFMRRRCFDCFFKIINPPRLGGIQRAPIKAKASDTTAHRWLLIGQKSAGCIRIAQRHSEGKTALEMA